MDETTRLDDAGRGRLAGRYILRGLLGQGGMADVELAYDEQLDRLVAVKLLHARYAGDASFLARFRREAQAVANLNHPNVVAVYDAGEQDGRPFIVMEYVRGKSLRDLVRTQAIQPERALEIVGDAALGLHYAHERGLIHRDIKPGNILVSDEGQVKVTDFGIARAVDAETVTQTATVFGTAAYVAPEQARGEEVDRRTDVYALGVVMYEVLTGRPPFEADSPVALAYKHVSEAPVPPSQLNPDVPEALDAIVMKAMAKDPANRYQTARELNADIQRAQAGMPVAAPPLSHYETTRVLERDRTMVAPPPPPRQEVAYEQYEEEPYEEERRPGVAWAILALLILAVAILAGVLLFNLLSSDEPVLVQVPDVRGMELVEAQQVLEEAGFDFRVAEERVESDEFAENVVVDTRPPPLSEAPEGSEIELILSAGPPLVVVPPVEGLTFEEAQAALVEADLSVGQRSEEPSDEFEEGIVIRSDPPEGTEVTEGSEVDLIVSSGPEAVTVPNVLNLPEDQAIETLENACEPAPCFAVRVEAEPSDEVPEGRVVSQDPQPNAEAAPGSRVTIVVSEGPRTVTLPNVENLPEEEAVRRLETACDADPCVNVNVRRDFNDTVAEGRVIRQEPGPQQEVRVGSNVTIVVSRGPEQQEPPPPEPDPTPTPTA